MSRKFQMKEIKGNKADFVKAYAKACSVTQEEAKYLTDTFLDLIEFFVFEGSEHKIGFMGWGTFSLVKRSARKYRNPSDRSQVIDVPSRKVFSFKPGSVLAGKAKKLS